MSSPPPRPGFPQLRVQSYYSFLRGLASPRALAGKAAALGCPALALTDRHSLTGAIEFYDACRKCGVKPVLGLEVLVAQPPDLSTLPAGVLVLLALDLEGWASLCRLATCLTSADEVLPFEKLKQHNPGLICLSGGLRGAVSGLLASDQPRVAEALLVRQASLFPGRFYVELQCHTSADRRLTGSLAELAGKHALPLAATHDIHYLDPGQGDLQKLVSAIRRNQVVHELPPEECAPEYAHFLSSEEMEERFADLPEALAGSRQVAERCRLELPVGTAHFPEFSLPPGKTVLDVLEQKARLGAHKIYAPGPDQPLPGAVAARLDHELDVIAQTGYAALFLIVEDILSFARRKGILFASRGSAASSLVAHCLGITTPDPVAHNLYFERFLNPARHSPPDIDTDLDSNRRDEVIRYVYERFGDDRVATVCTINRMRKRSALRAAAKAYGFPSDEISRMVSALPYRWVSPAQRGRKEDDPFEPLRIRYATRRHQELFQAARALIGLPDHLSVHPGGMVIAPGAITDLVPLQQAAKGVAITQFDLDSIERLGLVKIDLLGIRGLTVLAQVAETIAPPGQASDPERVLSATPPEDQAASDLLERGRTIGCFQIESPGMQATLRQIHARTENDILRALALYRPGPLTGGLKDAYVRRHRGLEDVGYLHPSLEPLLADTYGVILYQEQVLRIAHDLAGLSLADSDLLRRAMSHFDPGKQMQTLKEKFLQGALQRNNVPPEAAERIWELMAAFAGYGFPKAHAASYARLGWRLAWCKAHFPVQFLVAVLANWGGYYPQKVYLGEARRLGLRVRPPHINFAGREFCSRVLEDETVLFMGLDQVKDLGRKTQRRIVRSQPFASLDDFLARVDPHPKEVENLIQVGALQGFGTIPALLGRVQHGGWVAGQMPLFSLEPPAGEDWDLKHKVTAQQELLGAALDAHPLELVADQVRAAGAISTAEAAALVGSRTRLAGIRLTWHRSWEGGRFTYSMWLEDAEGVLDVVIPGGVYQRSRDVFKDSGPYLLEGMVEVDPETAEPYLWVDRAARLG